MPQIKIGSGCPGREKYCTKGGKNGRVAVVSIKQNRKSILKRDKQAISLYSRINSGARLLSSNLICAWSLKCVRAFISTQQVVNVITLAIS